MFIVFVTFVILNCIIFNYSKAEIGEPCQFEDETGLWLHSFNCHSLSNLLQKKLKTNTCGTNGFNILVCCPNYNPTAEIGSISQKKCKEYFQDDNEENLQTETPNSDGMLYYSSTSEPISSLRFSHVAILGYEQGGKIEWKCIGSLISPNFLLTSAHCADSIVRGTAKYVRMGTSSPGFEQHFTVSQTILHPEYNQRSKYHDIALLKLNKTAEFTDFVRPACLYTSHDLPPRQLIETTWRKTKNEMELKKETGCYIPYEECKEVYSSIPQLTSVGIYNDSQVCIRRLERTGLCQDSGALLQVKLDPGRKKPFYVVGMASFGVNICENNVLPNVHTRVSHFLHWIEKLVWPDD